MVPVTATEKGHSLGEARKDHSNPEQQTARAWRREREECKNNTKF